METTFSKEIKGIFQEYRLIGGVLVIVLALFLILTKSLPSSLQDGNFGKIFNGIQGVTFLFVTIGIEIYLLSRSTYNYYYKEHTPLSKTDLIAYFFTNGVIGIFIYFIIFGSLALTYYFEHSWKIIQITMNVTNAIHGIFALFLGGILIGGIFPILIFFLYSFINKNKILSKHAGIITLVLVLIVVAIFNFKTNL